MLLYSFDRPSLEGHKIYKSIYPQNIYNIYLQYIKICISLTYKNKYLFIQRHVSSHSVWCRDVDSLPYNASLPSPPHALGKRLEEMERIARIGITIQLPRQTWAALPGVGLGEAKRYCSSFGGRPPRDHPGAPRAMPE